MELCYSQPVWTVFASNKINKSNDTGSVKRQCECVEFIRIDREVWWFIQDIKSCCMSLGNDSLWPFHGQSWVIDISIDYINQIWKSFKTRRFVVVLHIACKPVESKLCVLFFKCYSVHRFMISLAMYSMMQANSEHGVRN